MPSSFGSKLQKAFDSFGQLCVGVDPHAALLADWGLPDSVSGLRSFSDSVVNAAAGRVGLIKPQVSFFERLGSQGFAVLEDLCQKASDSGLLVIMDVKRGDIGSTMDAYFDAWLGKGAPFLSDAITVSPYLGFDSLKPLLANSAELGKGVFVLAATSNPEGAALQQARIESGDTVAGSIWSGLAQINSVTSSSADSLGSFGAVLGATLNLAKFNLSTVITEQQRIATPILAPGFGAQGARLADTGRLFGTAGKQVIASVSRSILQAGPHALDEAIDAANAELAGSF